LVAQPRGLLVPLRPDGLGLALLQFLDLRGRAEFAHLLLHLVEGLAGAFHFGVEDLVVLGDDFVEAAAALDAAAVGLSVSQVAASGDALAAVADVRRHLPARTRLWLGGSGARALEGLPVNVQVVDTLDRLERALRALSD